MDRRDFMKKLAGATSALMLPGSQLALQGCGAGDRLGEVLPRRRLGRTGESVTMLGLGGWHVGGKMSEKEAEAVIETAIEGGVRFFDSAESYQDGESERRYGRFLTPKYRGDVFLMTKTGARDAAEARADLDGSLSRLKTDYVDLWQMHAVQSPEDVDGRLEAGVLDAMAEAKAAGKARHIGFTGHRTPSAHARVLERTDAFETCQMPVNLLDPSYESFIERVLPDLVARKTGVLAMKTLSNGRFFGVDGQEGSGRRLTVVPDAVSLEEAVRFVWSLPVGVLITGPDDREQMAEKIAFARSFTAMDEAERKSLVAKVAGLAGNRVEYYKA